MCDLFGWNVRVHVSGRTHYLAQNSREVAVARHYVRNRVARFCSGKQDREGGPARRVELDLIVGPARIGDGRLDDHARRRPCVRPAYAAHREAQKTYQIPASLDVHTLFPVTE